jgi:hypothetical protein
MKCCGLELVNDSGTMLPRFLSSLKWYYLERDLPE